MRSPYAYAPSTSPAGADLFNALGELAGTRNDPAVAEQPTGTVTLVFTDIERSTLLLQQLGRDRYAEALELHRRLLRKAFERHGGYEVDCEGDSFFIAFSRADDAVHAAKEVQQALAGSDWPGGNPLRVRIGIHTGEPLAAPPKYVGMDVHRAARIMAAGHGGQVLISQSTSALVAGVVVRDLGEHRLKDLTAPERVYQLGEGEFPALKSLSRTNLPIASSPLVGRERELNDLVELISDSIRVLTVTGPGGSGKTRLALQAAADVIDEFRDGVFFVPLAPLRDPSLVLPTALQTVGLNTLEELRELDVLLLLDNFEHLLAAAPSLNGVLSTAPRLKLLVTTRAPLRISGEREYALDPLTRADAMTLFVARAAAAGRSVAPDETVAEICDRLDNLPLAIELAAGRVRLLDPIALLERLERRLPLLTHGGRDAPERQRTLRATIDWSYDLLGEEQRRVMRSLGVFAGSFSFDAAERVAAAGLDELEALVELNLLKPIGGSRFLILATIREYAHERLDEDEQNLVERRHREYYAEFIAKSFASDQIVDPAWLDLIDVDQANYRAALTSFIDEGDGAVELVSFLGRFWHARGMVVEGLRWVEETLASDSTSGEPRELVLRWAFPFALYQGDYDRAEALARQRLELAESLENDRLIAQALMNMGRVAEARGDLDTASAPYEEALTIARRLNDPTILASSLLNVGWVMSLQGGHCQALRLVEQALDIYEQVGDGLRIAVALHDLGWLAVRRGDMTNAAARFRDSIGRGRSFESVGEIGGCLSGLGVVAEQAQADERALRLFAAWEKLLRESGHTREPWAKEVFDAVVDRLRERLPPPAFDLAWSEGDNFSLDDALDLALSSDEA